MKLFKKKKYVTIETLGTKLKILEMFRFYGIKEIN